MTRLLPSILICLGLMPLGHQALASSRTPEVKPDTIKFVAKRAVNPDTIDFSRQKRRVRDVDTLSFTPKVRSQRTSDQWLESMPMQEHLFRHDWFVFATGGVHAFFGDYSRDGSFSGTISPEVSAGFGYWFNPYIAVKAEFIRSKSRGYSRYLTGNHGFGYGDILQNKHGVYYRKMRVSWWDVSCSATVNLTRLILNYEGYRSLKNRNQVLLSAGVGCVHFLNYNQEHGSGYDWSGHVELQYSRFFDRRRIVSLDVKLRWLFYSTNFDYESEKHNRLIDRIDGNLGIHAGMTFYIGKLRNKKQLKNTLVNGAYDFRQ